MKSIIEYSRKPLGFFVFCGVILTLICSESCKNKATGPAITSEETSPVDTLPQDFVSFYDRFHTDSQYQMDHIIFPLEGLPNSLDDNDTIPTERFYWQRDNWVKHNHFTDPSGQFEHWYEVRDDRLIEHWVKMKGTNLVMRRRFAKMDDEWFLIYYAGMRPQSQE